jgi:hypothetical protein
VCAFKVEPAADWNRPKEQDQLLEPNADPVKVFSAVRGLQQFKAFLEKRVRDTFTTPDNLQAKVTLSLSPWLTDEIRRWDQAAHTQQRSGKRGNRVVAKPHKLATAIAVRDGHLVASQAEVNTGIPLAAACGYQLALIDLLLQRATLILLFRSPSRLNRQPGARTQ